MRATILSLSGVDFEGEITSFYAKTKTGDITVLDHHHPLITILEKGTMKVVTQEGEETFSLSSGFLKVSSENRLLALIER